MSYTKPMILVNDDLAEGVYAASGDVIESSGFSYSDLQLLEQWDGNKKYGISFHNDTDKKVDKVAVTLKANGAVTFVGGNVTGSVSGSTVTIVCNNYGNGIEAHSSVYIDYVLVQGTGAFSIE